MKTQASLALAGSCVLLLLAGCDRAKIDRLGETTRGSVLAVANAGAEAARDTGQAAADAGRQVAREMGRAVEGSSGAAGGRTGGVQEVHNGLTTR